MSCENNRLDVRGARLDIEISEDTVFNKAFTIKNDGELVDLSSYTNVVFRIETDPLVEYNFDVGISVEDSVITCDFEIDLAVGTYMYQMVGVRDVGETEFLRGKIFVR